MWYDIYKTQISDIVTYSRLCYNRNLVSAAGGNVSMRCNEGVLITASGISLRDITPESIILVTMEGTVLEGDTALRPSKELFFHLNTFRLREDADSIIHVHPPYATAFSLSPEPLPLLTVTAQLKLKKVDTIPEGKPGSVDLAHKVQDVVRTSARDEHAFLLQAHGLLVCEHGMRNCFDTAELVEETAKVAFFHSMLN